MPTIVRRRRNKKAKTLCRSSSTKHDTAAAAAVDAAVTSLERGVRTLVQRHERRLRKRLGGLTTTTAVSESQSESLLLLLPECVEERRMMSQQQTRIAQVLHHIRHCFTELRQKLAALRAGLECYAQQLLPSFQSHLLSLLDGGSNDGNSNNHNNGKKQLFTDRDHVVAVVVAALQHVFQWLLRLHDGYILTVSGECRHATDVQAAAASGNQYPSQLNNDDDNDNDAGDARATTATNNGSSSVLYATDHTYSGASWDEWMDSRRGLLCRLLTLLQPLVVVPQQQQQQRQQQQQSLWDDWTEPGQAAFPLETIVGDTEAQMQQIQSQFADITRFKLPNAIRGALQQLQSRRRHDSSRGGGNTTSTSSSSSNHNNNNASSALNVSVTLQWQDKMEQLHVTSAVTGGKVQLERYAGDFQVSGGSVLPVQYVTADHWWGAGGMQWTEQQQQQHQHATTTDAAASTHKKIKNNDERAKKRRKAIVDSSSSSDEDDTKKPQARVVVTKQKPEKENKPDQTHCASAAGLVVKVVEAVRNEAPVQSSVNAIKMQFGVNVEGMQAAFDGLQDEEAGAVLAADLVDNAPEDAPLPEERDERYDIQQAERRVKRKKRALLRVMEDAGYDADADTAIWNAREILREALMRAGDLIMWSDVVRSSNDDMVTTTRSMLQRAIQYFADSKALVAAQQKLHERMNHNKDPNDDIRFFRRNLLLLKGQAQTNTGIATIELALHCYHERDPVRKVQLHMACKELDAAVVSANAMKSRASEDAVTAFNPAETTLDSLRAQQLESLALRWKATALWHLYEKRESFQTFQAAASVLQGSRSPSSNSLVKEVVDAAIECRVECYNAWTTLADLASRSMERATVALIRESPAFNDKLMDYVVQALKNASTASKSFQADLRSTPEKYESLCKEGILLTSEDLLQSLSDIQEWWNRRKTAATQKIMDASSKPVVVSCSRNDLLADGGPPSSEALPTRRFIAEPRSRRRSQYNLGGVGYSNIGTTVDTFPNERVVTPREPRKYRKWREDMIVDEKTGRLVPKLVYPSIAPVMPPHIAAILAARKQATGH